MKTLICKICDKAVANSNNVLARHVRTAHETDWPEYIVKYEHNNIWPVCICGCSERLPWRKGGFAKYIKGHDNSGLQNSMSVTPADVVINSPGWFANPFNGQEEYLATYADVELFNACVKANDPVYVDSGAKIPWEDSSGKIHLYKPSLLHLKKKIIYIIDDFADREAQRRFTAIKDWCIEHARIAIILKQDVHGLIVHGGFNPDS